MLAPRLRCLKSRTLRSHLLAMIVAGTSPIASSAVSAVPPGRLQALRAQFSQSARHMSRAQLQSSYVFRKLIDRLSAPIHSRAQLSAYLKRSADSDSPLDALPPDARQRFLASLRFRNGGLASLSYADLLRLNAVQIYRILALFGAQSATQSIAGSVFRSLDVASAGATSAAHSSRAPKLHAALKYALQVDENLSRAPDRQHESVIEIYEKRLAPAQKPSELTKLSDRDLADLFEATSAATHAAANLRARNDFTTDLTLDMQALTSRHLASNAEYRHYYQSLVSARHFNAARRFYSEHPQLGLPPLPTFLPQISAVSYRRGSPLVFSPHSAGRVLTVHRISLRKASQAVILVSPDCHFSTRFLRAADRHPRLLAALSSHSVWVTPPDGILQTRTLASWNRAHPLESINIIDEPWEWPMIKTMAVPTFYFLHRGRLVATVSGWPEAGRFLELRTDLRKIGLWPPARK